MTGFSSRVRAVITERSGFYCERDGCGIGTEAHHRRPRGMGGTNRSESNRPSNGLWLAPECHQWIESHRAQALEAGWLVRQHDEPADVPVLYRGTRVWLDDLGNMHDHPQHTEAAS